MRETSLKTCIVIPCYNEVSRMRLSELVRDLSLNRSLCLFLVDDGSTDNTADFLRVIEKEFPDRVAVVALLRNSGKAEAVRTGILKGLEHFAPDLIGYIDADLATPLSEVERFIEIATRMVHVKMLSGCRFKRLGAGIERLWWRHYLGRIFATAASICLGIPVYDTQCGAKVFRSEDAKHLFAEPFVSRWFFDVEVFARMISHYGRKATTLQIVEVPLEIWKDMSGSKTNLGTYTVALIDLARIYFLYRRRCKA